MAKARGLELLVLRKSIGWQDLTEATDTQELVMPVRVTAKARWSTFGGEIFYLEMTLLIVSE